MAWNEKTRADGQSVAEHETKLCPLCESLNYHHNVECLTCGWRGAFVWEAAALHLVWQQLAGADGEIRLEQLTPRAPCAITEMGQEEKAGWWRQWRAECARWWQRVLARRAAGGAARDPSYQRRQPTWPPSELGV